MTFGKVRVRPVGRGRTQPELAKRTTFRLRGGPHAAADARERLAALRQPLPPSIGAAVSLLLTELVTNAVRHGGAGNGQPVAVAVEHWPAFIRVSVSDPGRGFRWRPPNPRRPPEEGGYGLVLVDRMTRRWGIETSANGTIVWFELSAD